MAEAAWAIGYAAPLLRLLNHRSFLLSFWGPSHGGKSACQALAISPWGRPEDLKLSGDATSTAIEANLARCNDLPSWVDDAQQTRSQAVLEGLAYQIGGGTGRGRGTVSGGIRQIASWRGIGFVSGEHPLLKIGAADGARNRTLEMHVEPLPKELAAQVHRTLDVTHGLTGRSFIENVLAQVVIPKKIHVLDEQSVLFANALGVDARNQDGKYIAFIALADFMARIFVFGEEDHVARAAAVAMGKALVTHSQAQRDTAINPIQAGYEAITAWVAEHDGFFGKDGPKCYGRFLQPGEAGGRRAVAILPGPLQEAMKAVGLNREEVVHGLLERGLIIPGEKKRNTRKIAISGGRVRAYWVILPDDDGPKGGGGSPPAPGPGPDAGQVIAQQFYAAAPECPTDPPAPEANTLQYIPAAGDVGAISPVHESLPARDNWSKDHGTNLSKKLEIEGISRGYRPTLPCPSKCPTCRPTGTAGVPAPIGALPPRHGRSWAR